MANGKYVLWVVALCLAPLVCNGCASTASAPTRPTEPPATTTVAMAPAAVPTEAPTAIPTEAPTAIPTAAPTVVPTPTATVAPTPTPSPTACGETAGQIVREQIKSAALGKAQAYRVYLPPCYQQQEARRYPVVYLLHGAGHDDGYWDDVGVDEAADPLIADGTIPPLIIVLPDGNRTFGSRNTEPPPFAQFMLDELIPQIDANYRTLADREHRAIGGISLGGAWALLLAARSPETFGAVGGHSPAIGRLNNINPSVDALVAGKVRVYLDVGEDDSLRAATAAFDKKLTQAGYAHEFHVYPGGHTEPYWTSHLEEYLRFYTEPWKE